MTNFWPLRNKIPTKSWEHLGRYCALNLKSTFWLTLWSGPLSSRVCLGVGVGGSLQSELKLEKRWTAASCCFLTPSTSERHLLKFKHRWSVKGQQKEFSLSLSLYRSFSPLHTHTHAHTGGLVLTPCSLFENGEVLKLLRPRRVTLPSAYCERPD